MLNNKSWEMGNMRTTCLLIWYCYYQKKMIVYHYDVTSLWYVICCACFAQIKTSCCSHRPVFTFCLCYNYTHTDECHQNANMTWYGLYHCNGWGRVYTSVWTYLQNTYHSSPQRASCGMYFVRILKKIDCIITALQCIQGERGDCDSNMLSMDVYSYL